MLVFIKSFFKKNILQIRYIISGIFFTLVAPSLFILVTKLLPPQLAIVCSEIFIHFFRFNVVTKWVFQSKVNKQSLKAYIKATIPLFICNFLLVTFLASLIGTVNTAIIIGLFSATAGFLWNKICYAKTTKR